MARFDVIAAASRTCVDVDIWCTVAEVVCARKQSSLCGFPWWGELLAFTVQLSCPAG